VLSDPEARTFSPTVVHVDHDNRIVAIGTDPAEDVAGVIHDSATR
jgi:aspartate 1-decarboxylase